MTYRVVIDRLTDEDGGGYLATVPSFPGCMTDGETRAEAAGRIDDAIRAWLSANALLGRKPPGETQHD